MIQGGRYCGHDYGGTVPDDITGNTMETPTTHAQAESLELRDTISLVVGIVVGVAIFKTPPNVFLLAGSPGAGLAIWGLGAVLALTGALCYAELSAAYPEFGAEYVFLSRAFGAPIGFLFAWMQTCTVITGSVGAMAFVFADYAAQLQSGLDGMNGLLAAGAIAGLTAVQLLGFRSGRGVQNLLTALKVCSLTALLVCGLLLASPASVPAPDGESSSRAGNWGLALVFVLYAYGGWSDAATVTPEVRDCRRNMPRALLIALALIAGLYLAINLSFLRALGFHGLCVSPAPAADVIRRTLGPTSSSLMSLMIMISALGSIHGMMFAGCRLLAAVGRDYVLFGRWNSWTSRRVPVWSLLTISSIALFLTALVGTSLGRAGVDRAAALCHLPAPQWEEYGGGFEMLVAASAPIFWTFFLLSGLSLMILRIRDPLQPRPFRVPGYPVTPLIFCTTAGFMLWSSLQYAGKLTLLLLPVFLAGAALACFQRPRESMRR